MRMLQAIGLAALALAANVAVAIPITVTANGSITDVIAADSFGTQIGDAISLRATFDSSALVDIDSLFGISVPGVQFASLATDPHASMQIKLGKRTWSAQDEPFFGSDFFGLFPTPLPHVVLLNGRFFGLNYFGIGPGDDVFVNDAVGQLYFGSPAGQILGGNSDPASPPFWVGQWDLDSAVVSAPEPGSLALLICGLSLLVASSRTRRSYNRRR